jgi:ABC-type transport system involved in multi-copper enzyme maturation permease subunit
MARPYLAIIKDAFRATIASRVLYVMVGLIVLILAVLAPLHIRETLDWEVSRQGLEASTEDILKEIADKKDNTRYPIVTRIWSRFSPENQTKFLAALEQAKSTAANNDAPEDTAKSEEDSDRRRKGKGPRRGSPLGVENSAELAEELNRLMRDRSFYDEEIWKSQILKSEAKDLVTEGVSKLSAVRVARLNRLLINDAVRSLPTPNKSSAKLYYAIWHFSAIPSETTRSQILQPVTSTLRFILDKFVLSLGILIAVIVTANMIPETFEPGSLNLLLSKPIYRAGLLISKFVGGTAFIALCGTMLFAGIYLWMGIGLGLWDNATLWSIPLYVVVFAIYFSVSVFVGLLYRSAIVSVVLTGIFWAVCFAVGTANNFLASRAENQQLIWGRSIGGKTYSLNKFSELMQMNDNIWQPIDVTDETMDDGEQIGLAIIKSSANIPIFPFAEPIADQKTGQIVCVLTSPMELPGIPRGQVLISDPSQSRFRNYRLPSPIAVFGTMTGPIIVSNDGRLKRLKLDQLDLAAPRVGKGVEMLKDEFLEDLGPDQRVDLRFASRVAYNKVRNEFAMLSGGVLYVYGEQGGQYKLARQIEIDSGSDRKSIMAHVAYGKDHLALAFGNANVLILDAETLKQVGRFQPESRSPPIILRADPESAKVAVLFRNGRLWKWEPNNPGELKLETTPAQRSISGLSMNSGVITICHNIDRVSTLDANGRLTETRTPSGDFFMNLYRYALKPMYLVFPKPGEFYRLVDYLSSSRNTKYDANVDLTEVDDYKNPWSPLWSGLGFMAFMLGLSSIYFSRLDC